MDKIKYWLLAGLLRWFARMSTPGGHGADWGDTNTTKWVATAESARREVQALQPYRPDYIKAFADGWRYGQLPDEVDSGCTQSDRADLSGRWVADFAGER